MNRVTLYTPFFSEMANRASVGMGDFFKNLEDVFNQGASNYPPMNLRKVDENHYALELAVAGFGETEISVTEDRQHNRLVVSGRKDIEESDSDKDDGYVYHGIATRNFQRSVALHEWARVESAKLENGMLIVNIVKEIPEELQPRVIEINKPALTHVKGAKKAA